MLASSVIQQLGRVAVVMGGVTERDVSLAGGRAIYNAFVAQGIDVIALEVEEDLITPFQHNKVDRVFNVLHGGAGEGGILQAILQSLHIPYTDSSPKASALALDKMMSKQIFRAHGLSVLPDMYVTPEISVDQIVTKLGLPFVLKPYEGGSSIGISIIRDKQDYSLALAEAFKFSNKVMAEKFVEGAEFSVGILGDRALPVVRITPEQGFYDYNAKYLADNTRHEIGEHIASEDIQTQCQQLALAAFHALDCRYWGRVDIMMDKAQQLYILEVNTVTGMTTHSIVPKAAATLGISFDALVTEVLLMTLHKSG